MVDQRPIHFGGAQLAPLPQPGPAGEASPEARLVTVSRWSLAARIKQGVRLADLRTHFEALLEAEEALLSE